MAEVADFVPIISRPETADDGHWTSPKFASGGRNTRGSGDEELDNAYLTATMSQGSSGDSDLAISIWVNGNAMSDVITLESAAKQVVLVTFRGSFLTSSGVNNVVELRDTQARRFVVWNAVVAFRQNS